MKPKIFLSYSRDDLDMMQHVKDSLTARGLNVWTDEQLQPGSPRWESEIAEAIENSQAMVVILTPSAKSSIWVGREMSYAEQHGVRIFPLLASGTEKTSIPMILISTQHVDIRSGFASGIEALTNALHDYLGIDVIRPEVHTDRTEELARFIANSTHDMRSMLAVIRTSTHFLSHYKESVDEERRELLLARINEQTERLSRFLDDIGEITRLERGILPKPREATDLQAQLSELVDYYRDLATTEGIEVVYREPDQPIFAVIAEDQLRRVVDNLLSNAVKYSNPNGIVKVSIMADGTHAHLQIIDNGIGIAAEDQSRIFTRFFRGDNAEGVSQGTGLGLAITREIVEFYGGSISFESELGKGSTFTIRLPLASEPNEE